jgi:hypothetical protein
MRGEYVEVSLGKRRRFTRRWLMAAGGSGAIAAILAACGQLAAPTAAPAKPTEAPKPAVEPTKPAAAAEATKPAAAPATCGVAWLVPLTAANPLGSDTPPGLLVVIAPE